MNNKPSTQNSNSHLWHFSFTATGILLIAAFALTATLYAVHQQRLQDQIARAELFARIFVDEFQVLGRNDTETLKNELIKLMQVDYYQSSTLIDESGTIIFEYGLPLAHIIRNSSFNKLEHFEDERRSFLSIPILASDGIETPENYRLILAIDTSVISLLNLQFLFASGLILLIITIFSVAYYHKLNRSIFFPLEKLNNLISKQNQTRSNSPILLEENGVFEELIQHINESFSIQIENQMDFRKGIENATQELRESLETVEIQNIDLDLARKNAVKLNKLKSDFLKKTSQDLRTPLSGILGFTELVRKTNLSREQSDYLATIEDSTKGLLTIVSDIHDFSMLESGGLQVERKQLDLRETIEDTLVLQAPLANEREVSLYSSFEQDVPNEIVGDPIRIQQVLSNLVSNAIKFDRATYVEAHSSVINHPNHQCTLSIKISTDGQCPEEFSTWKTQSSELDKSKSFYSGISMGLSIAKGIAQHMKGKITFHDEELRLFEFSLVIEKAVLKSVTQSPIPSTYAVDAVVYTNTDSAYREVTSRLNELGIRNARADTFSEIHSLVKKQQDSARKRSRALSIAVIEAQTSQQTLDKIVLTQTIKSLVEELGCPTVIIAPSRQYESLRRILNDIDVHVLQHPILTRKFRRGILDQLGVVKVATDKKNSASNHSIKTIKMLLVDDNDSNIKLAKALLTNYSISVESASSGEEALNLFAPGKFDIIFMDIELPGKSGLETTKLIRANEKSGTRVPIVAVTAHAIESEKKNFLLAGMDDCLEKPLIEKDIATILDRWTESETNSKSTIESSSRIANIKSDKNDPITDKQDLASDTASPISIAECLKLSKNDPVLACDMLKMLIETLDQEKQQIILATEMKDYSGNLYDTIHRLHGACCYTGAIQLKKLCKQTDINLKNNKTDTINEDIEEIVSSIDELLSWSRNYDINALFETP